MEEPEPKPDPGRKIVTHVGHISEDVPIDSIHDKYLERAALRQNLKWAAIVVLFSLLVAGLSYCMGAWGTDARTGAPGHEPGEQSRQ